MASTFHAASACRRKTQASPADRSAAFGGASIKAINATYAVTARASTGPISAQGRESNTVSIVATASASSPAATSAVHAMPTDNASVDRNVQQHEVSSNKRKAPLVKDVYSPKLKLLPRRTVATDVCPVITCSTATRYLNVSNGFFRPYELVYFLFAHCYSLQRRNRPQSEFCQSAHQLPLGPQRLV